MKKNKSKKSKKRSYSSSQSSSRSRSHSKQKRKSNSSSKSKQDSKIKKIQEQEEQPNQRPYKVNKFALGSMLFENRRTNDRMDRTEVQQANNELKKIDKSGRQSILLSAAINTVQVDMKKDDYIVELIDGQYVKTPKPYQCGFHNCQMRFISIDELTKHLKEHEKIQTAKNNQRAQKFMENL